VARRVWLRTSAIVCVSLTAPTVLSSSWIGTAVTMMSVPRSALYRMTEFGCPSSAETISGRPGVA